MPDPYSLSVVTFNVSGIPTPPSARQRMSEIARHLDAQAPDVVNLQEVHTYGLLHILAGSLPSLPHASWKPGLVGPRGGLVTFSRHPISRRSYVPWAPAVRRLGGLAPRRALFDSLHKGVLVSEFASLPATVFNTHLVANTDGDWSPSNRFHATHQALLGGLRDLTRRQERLGHDLVVTGDFNIARDSVLYGAFVREAGWHDAFEDVDAPTFHVEYLPPGAEPHCIDFLLARGDCRTENASLLFEERAVLGEGRRVFLSHHVALRATLAFRS